MREKFKEKLSKVGAKKEGDAKTVVSKEEEGKTID